MITRRRLLHASAAVAASGIGLGGYTWLLEPHRLELVHRDLPIRRLPSALLGARLVQLADVHVGPVSDGYLLETFRRVAALEPAIVVYTGDLISHHDGIFDHAARMYAAAPRGTLATLGTLGNHDYGAGWSQAEMADALSGILRPRGIRILRNEVADVEGLQIVGMDDLWAHRFDPATALAAADLSRAMLVLSHNPDPVDRPGWSGFDGWILAGHTHGGQCKPPFLPPPMLPVANKRYSSGAFDLPGGRTLYISRGVGHWLPLRFNVRPEATVFTLQRA
jgi:predicted MPP superfamily phosphohydrolase